jgi:hypothetical protein
LLQAQQRYFLRKRNNDNHNNIDIDIMAEAQLRERRVYLGLARQVCVRHEQNLSSFDVVYKRTKDRIMFKLLLATIDDNKAKKKRLAARIESFSKVSKLKA